jgi:predicted TPR repeat methyltransferase
MASIPSISEERDYKTRLYEHFLTHSVCFDHAGIQTVLRHRRPYLKQMIAAFVPPDRTTRILDLGCGYGAILYELRSLGYAQLTGVDVSPEQVQQARELGFGDVHRQEISAFLAKTPDAAYDTIIAFDVFEHFAKQQIFDLFEQAHRLLPPGGRLIFHAPNAEGIFSGFIHSDFTHEQPFSRGIVRQLAAAIGFRVVAVQEEQPVIHGVVSLIRSLIWRIGTLPFRLLALAETGAGFSERPLSQNLLAVLERI